MLILASTVLTSKILAADPYPISGANNIGLDPTLTWPAVPGATQYFVYFGTAPTPDTPEFRRLQPGTNFWPGTLQQGTTYHWKVQGANSSGSPVGSPVTGNFATKASVRDKITVVMNEANMPAEPSPILIRNWATVAKNLDKAMTNKAPYDTGLGLPLMKSEPSPINFEGPFYFVPSFVRYTTGGDTGALGTMANVVGATLCGVDKSNDNAGQLAVDNYVKQQAQYFNWSKGLNVICHSTDSEIKPSMWYQLVAGVMFFQLVDLYSSDFPTLPDPPPSSPVTDQLVMKTTLSTLTMSMREIMEDTARSWKTAEGKLKPLDFQAYSYDFTTGTVIQGNDPAGTPDDDEDNEKSTNMPHTAAPIAWLQYMAYKEFGEPAYLSCARDAMNSLSGFTNNPSHDLLLPYGAILAARMNAAEDTKYDVGKIVNWHFDQNGTVNLNTGVAYDSGVTGGTSATYGNIKVHGLVGKPGIGMEKVYAANTFMSGGILAPMARYDQRYARSIGKWLLHLVTNARYFYQDPLDADHQTSKDYPDDDHQVFAYEFLADNGFIPHKPLDGFHSVIGARGRTLSDNTTIDFDWIDGVWRDADNLCLTEESASPDPGDRLEYTMKMRIKPGFNGPAATHKFVINAKLAAMDPAEDTGFDIFYRLNQSGPWTKIGTIAGDPVKAVSGEYKFNFSPGLTTESDVYFKIADNNRTTSTVQNRIWIDYITVQTFDDNTKPYLGGGHMFHGGYTNLCTYQSASVGYIGGIVEEVDAVNFKGVLKVNLNKTDFFADPSFPTYLYYNPKAVSQNIPVNVGTTAVDVYDTTTHRFLLRNVTGVQNLAFGPKSARVLVFTTPGAAETLEQRLKKVAGKTIDFYAESTLFHDDFETQASPSRGWSLSPTYTAINGPANLGTGGSYGLKIAKVSSGTKALSTVGYENVRVKYRRTTSAMDPGENLVVEWSANGGSTWNALEEVAGGSSSTALQDKTLPATADGQTGFCLRFRMAGNAGADYAYIDDVEIVGSGKATP